MFHVWFYLNNVFLVHRLRGKLISLFEWLSRTDAPSVRFESGVPVFQLCAASIPWPCILIGIMIWLNQGAVLFRRRHDFCKQRETSALSRGNIIEDFIDFSSLFSLDSDEGENEYGPEPWDSKK